MIYLVFSIVLFQSASASVVQSTGDLAFGTKLMTVPGVNGFDQDVSLAYVAGGGVSVMSPASWVGLGWSLDVGAVTRSVIGLPDDLKELSSKKAIDMYYHDEIETDCSIGGGHWWECWKDVVIAVVMSIIILIVTFGTEPSSWMNLVNTLYQAYSILSAVKAVLDVIINGGSWNDAITSVASVAISYAGGGGIYGAVKEVGKVVKVARIVMGIGGIAGAASSTMQAYGMSAGSTYKVDDPKYFMGPDDSPITGSLYFSDRYENYNENNPMMTDGGQPDIWSVAGGPVSGKMIIASEEMLSSNYRVMEWGGTPKFFLSKTPGLKSSDINYILDHSNDPYGSDFGSIDMFIVTASDGTRYIYGNPNIEGSIERVHAVGSYSYMELSEGATTSQVWIRKYTLNHYPTAWKLTAKLAPNYVDGGGDPYDPLDSESSNKGPWVAYNYDLVHTYEGDGGNCGYNFGPQKDGLMDETVANWETISGGYRDTSYLSNIITPLYEAEFFISERKDGAEVDPWDSGYTTSPYTWDFNNGWTGSCISTPKDHLYKLDRIELKSREGTGEILQRVYFNKDETDAEMYTLKPLSIDGASNFDYKVYALNTVNICGKTEASCDEQDPYVFEYANICVPDCEGKVCGDNGCGGECGVPPFPNSVCSPSQTWDCTGDCTGTTGDACAYDGCGEFCTYGVGPTPYDPCTDLGICSGTIDDCNTLGLFGDCGSGGSENPDIGCDYTAAGCGGSVNTDAYYCSVFADDVSCEYETIDYCTWDPDETSCGLANGCCIKKDDAPSQTPCLENDLPYPNLCSIDPKYQEVDFKQLGCYIQDATCTETASVNYDCHQFDGNEYSCGQYEDNGCSWMPATCFLNDCVQCITTADCGEGSGLTCISDPTSPDYHTCVSCAAQCTGKCGGYNGCDGICENNCDSQGSTPVCSSSTNTCVECVSDFNCPYSDVGDGVGQETCVNNECVCTPRSCEVEISGKQVDMCGTQLDGCGNLMDCGGCTAPDVCQFTNESQSFVGGSCV